MTGRRKSGAAIALVQLDRWGWIAVGLFAADILLLLLVVREFAFNLTHVITFGRDVWNAGEAVKTGAGALVALLALLSVKLPKPDPRTVSRALFAGRGSGSKIRIVAYLFGAAGLTGIYVAGPDPVYQTIDRGDAARSDTYAAYVDNFPTTGDVVRIEPGTHVVRFFAGPLNTSDKYEVRIVISEDAMVPTAAAGILFQSIGFDPGFHRKPVWPDGASVRFACDRSEMLGRHALRFVLAQYNRMNRRNPLYLHVEILNGDGRLLATYTRPLLHV